MEPIVFPANTPLKPYHHPADPSLRRSPAFTPFHYERRVPIADPFKLILRQTHGVATKVGELTLAHPIYPEYTASEPGKCVDYHRLMRRLQLQLLAVGDTRWTALTDEQRLAANTQLVFIWIAYYQQDAPDTLHLLGALYTEASNNRWELPRIFRELQRQHILPRHDQLTDFTTTVNSVVNRYEAPAIKCRLNFISAKPYTVNQIFTVLLGLGTP